MKTAGPKLELTVDYGKLTILAQPLFWLLAVGAQVRPQLGRRDHPRHVPAEAGLLQADRDERPLHGEDASDRSRASRAIQERYKDDREQLAKQTMELYKREKINPVAGCLPILVQIPVFLAFYWVLLESVEMRQAPFFGWIQDLSSKDPYFILPIIMGIAMFGAVQAEPGAAGSHAGEDVRLHAGHHDGDDGVVPGGPGAVLDHQHRLSIPQQWNINRVVEAEAGKSSS